MPTAAVPAVTACLRRPWQRWKQRHRGECPGVGQGWGNGLGLLTYPTSRGGVAYKNSRFGKKSHDFFNVSTCRVVRTFEVPLFRIAGFMIFFDVS